MLGYDAAWGAPDPHRMKDVGYDFAVRYLGGGARLTAPERDDIHQAGLSILLVMEQAADQADHPENAQAQALQAQQEADQLGYPDGCPIFFADDRNDVVDNEGAYFQIVDESHRRETGAYGPLGTLLIAQAEGTEYGWGVGTWGLGESPGGVLPPSFPSCVNIVQLGNLHAPCPNGIDPASFDTNVLIRELPMWAPDGSATTGGLTMPSTDEIVHALTDKSIYGVSPIGVAVEEALAAKIAPPTWIDGKPWMLIDWIKLLGTVEHAGDAKAIGDAVTAALAAHPAGGTIDAAELAKAVVAELGSTLAAAGTATSAPAPTK